MRKLRLKLMLSLLVRLTLMLCMSMSVSALAQDNFPLLTLNESSDGVSQYSVSIKILLVMTVLTLLPGLLMAMTAFTRIIIVFAILRQAMGMPQTPSNQILLAMTLFLTIFIMQPILEKSWKLGIEPYMNKQLDEKSAFNAGMGPVREFMFNQTRDKDLLMFADIRKLEPFSSKDDVPLSVLVPAFITSELKTAFQIGFLLFIPFVVIDLVVASILMSMGMMMLSPMIISLPFKLMLFVLVDGWALMMTSLVNSFYV